MPTIGTHLTKKPTPKVPAAPVEAAAALAKVEAELMALDPLDIVDMTVDVPTAVSFVLGTLPALRLLRADIIKKLSAFRIELLDKLETYALAAYYAHLAALPEAPDPRLPELAREASALRAALLADAEALALGGLICADAVADIRAGQGRLDTANDLIALAALFSSSWRAVRGEATSKPSDIRRAALLGPQLIAALGLVDRGRHTGDQAEERRARAFSLMARAYNRTRCAVACVRWDERDGDILTPPLSAGARWPAAESAAAPGLVQPAWVSLCDRVLADFERHGPVVYHR